MKGIVIGGLVVLAAVAAIAAATSRVVSDAIETNSAPKSA